MSTYTIQAGDTFASIAAAFGTTVDAIEAVNPGVDPLDLQIGQVVNLPVPGGNPGGGYVNYSGPASNFPDPSQWASYTYLWSFNATLMTGNEDQSIVDDIGQAIQIVSSSSGFDARVILCIIMQESGGNVNVKDTNNGVRNTGIMQAHDGSDFDPQNPAASILRMVQDGTTGTWGTNSPNPGDGLLQLYNQWGNYYEAFRAYNSGSVDVSNLNDPEGAKASYVTDVANRLMGHTWPDM